MLMATDALAKEISRCMLRDRERFLRRLRELERSVGERAEALRARLLRDIKKSDQLLQDRRANLPKPTYPSDLPVVQRREEIARAIAQHQVVVICGETGSGKTTQLPKICLELGRGVEGMIGHTQPRRIAARSVARRIAEELDAPLGQHVAYKMRFADNVSPLTHVKVMTDGILLAETQGDRQLHQYDTIIIDEAHERSLNIDFLLGYLKQLLPARPDLKLIITSATIDPQRFSRHFNSAPIIEVSGRTYPVEVRYRPVESAEDDPDFIGAIDELWRDQVGDVLLFLSGEREIRETSAALRQHHGERVEVLPLYARLSAAEQSRIFEPHERPRIVVATNVAETSLTVPGIRYVIDTGLARISRFAPRSRVQRLPVERISQASAQQRAGRCGRIASGVCVRLYSEEDFNLRPRFTEPEILRTNLASVILQMKALNLGEIQDFPFLDGPDYRQVRDGLATLHELGAIDENNRITRLGRDLARLPIDPRLARMVLESAREGCMRHVLVIVAALSIQDPRERPLDKPDAADTAHDEFADPRSDFLSLLNLWQAYHDDAHQLSSSKLRAWCRERFVSYVRMREWADVHQQLRGLAREVLPMRIDHRRDRKWKGRELPNRLVDAIHRALLSGLLSNVGHRDGAHEYVGPRGVRFHIFPGSALFKSRPPWVMCAELVETTKLYARTVALTRAKWIEQAAEHLVTRTYSDPRWDALSASVIASEKVSLHGMVLVPQRWVHYGAIDPVVSREIFIHDALVNGQYRTDAPFLAHNRKVVEDVEQLQAKLRRGDLLVEPEKLSAFYDARLPRNVFSGQTFEKWRRHVERGHPTLLFMQRRHVMTDPNVQADAKLYPDELRVGESTFPLRYVFDPASANDGVTVTIPLAALNQLAPEPFEWLVPGYLREKLIALIRSMPKALRVKFVPVPEHADKVLAQLRVGDGSLLDQLAHQLGRIAGEYLDRNAFDLGAIEPHLRMNFEPHLRMNFEIIDAQGEVVRTGRDLEQIRRELGMQARRTFRSSEPLPEFHRDGLTSWEFDDLPERVEVRRNGVTLQGYPALVDAGMLVSLRLFDAPEAATEAHRAGVRRLLTLQLREELKWITRRLPQIEQMTLHYATIGSAEDLKADLVTAIAERALPDDAAEVRTRDAFVEQAAVAWRRLNDAAVDFANLVAQILEQHQSLLAEMEQPAPPLLERSIARMREHLARLVYDGFLVEIPQQWLTHYPRYLAGIETRLRKLKSAGLSRDQQLADQVEPLWRQYLERREKHRQEEIVDPEVDRYRWMLEELCVSLFAQELKTSIPVSTKRMEAQWARVKI